MFCNILNIVFTTTTTIALLPVSLKIKKFNKYFDINIQQI